MRRARLKVIIPVRRRKFAEDNDATSAKTDQESQQNLPKNDNCKEGNAEESTETSPTDRNSSSIKEEMFAAVQENVQEDEEETTEYRIVERQTGTFKYTRKNYFLIKF